MLDHHNNNYVVHSRSSVHIISSTQNFNFCLTQMSMNVRQTTRVMNMQTVMIVMAATGVSAGQDSWETDTTAQVSM